MNTLMVAVWESDRGRKTLVQHGHFACCILWITLFLSPPSPSQFSQKLPRPPVRTSGLLVSYNTL